MKATPFSTLITHEMERLETVLAAKEVATYPIVFRAHHHTPKARTRSRILSLVHFMQFLI